MDIMKSVKLENTRVSNILEDFKNIWWDKKEIINDIYVFPHTDFSSVLENREKYISDQYKKEIMERGNAHNGYPEQVCAWPLAQSRDSEYFKKYSDTNEKLQIELGTRHNALCSVYPPGGYISWHNNANASAYNIILTWSENGDGWFKYVDPNTNETITVPDVAGWQAKAFYFGSYEDDPKHLVYHAASTDCWRMTISYTFDRDHKDFWEEAIEEMEIND